MSVRVTWQPSTDPNIFSYDLEKSPTLSGPWAPLATVPHVIPGLAWDAVDTVFFCVDLTGNEAEYYRITAVDSSGQRSASSVPFRAGTAPSGLPSLVKTITVTTGNVATLLNLGFFTIEIWESTNAGGTWKEITSSSATRPVLESAGFYNTNRVGNLSFRVKVNGGAEQVVGFDGAVLQDWTAQQVAGRINEVIPGLASVVGVYVRLTGPTAGRGGSLEVTSDPIPLFGASKAHGQDQRLLLMDGVMVYQYFDVAGSPTSRYRWRFSANGSAPFTMFSGYTTGQEQALLDTTRTSVATARFVNADGTVAKRTVLLAPVGELSMVDGLVVGSDRSFTYSTDDFGQLQITLIRGLRVRVGIEGTPFIREFTVPDLPSFDLLQAMATAPDIFTIQETTPLLTRRHI